MHNITLRPKKGFTLTETLISVSIMMLILLCGWSMYVMGWAWWNELSPTTECQRMARVALMSVMDGVTDQSAGTDVVNLVTYKRRIGMGLSNRTYADTQNLSFSTPVISAEGRRIDFKLEPDPAASNIRRYYLSQDANGVKGVYYQYSDSAAQLIKGTAGITDIIFETVSGYTNLLKVTVTAQKDIRTMRQGGGVYQAVATYSDYVFLRNI